MATDKTLNSEDDTISKKETIVRVMILSWNVGNCQESSLDESILFNRSDFKDPTTCPDIVVVGFQEVDASIQNNILRHWSYSSWSLKLMQQMSSLGYLMLEHESFPGLLSILFVSYDWLPFVNSIESDTTKLMFESLVGSKGAIGIRAQVGNQTLCFLNSHLPAHLLDHKERDKAYLTILADQFYSKCQSTVLNHDFVFWFGDLNFRIDDITNSEVKRLVSEQDYEHLLKHDQLKFSMASGRSFSSFEEGDINFDPTYKFNVGTQSYDTSEKRRKPAWCDRILWRDKPHFKVRNEKAGVVCLKYNSIAECCASDHKPVIGFYQIRLEDFSIDQPLILIELPDSENNSCGEDAVPCLSVKKGEKFKFRLKTSREFTENIDPYDWIGVYMEYSIKLKDYCSSTYVSNTDWTKGRVKFSHKDFKDSESGRYRLIYHSAKLKSAVGSTKLFQIK